MIPDNTTPFDYKKLHEFFSNVHLHSSRDKRVDYLLRNEDGHMVDEIVFLTPFAMRILVDNYPGQKLYFSSDLPITSMEQFQSDVERTGIKLIRETKRVGCAACDRGDFQLGHADDCPKNNDPDDIPFTTLYPEDPEKGHFASP
jgi:hypothetical protein